MPETAAANSPAPRFSVIVPVYNVERYLPACVKSVVESPGPRDWECILIDDGSTDASGAMCDAFAAACPGVRALHQKNAGLAAARNAGLAAARGAWLLFLDSDDEWPAAMLQNLRREMDAHPGYDWYVGRYLERDEAAGTVAPPGQIAFVPGGWEGGTYPERVARLYGSAHWAVWKYCLRRSLLTENGIVFWPDVVWAEDYPFDLLLLQVCSRLYFMDMVVTVYRANRAGSLMNANLPQHFAGIAAALGRFQAGFAAGRFTAAEQAEILRRLGNAFWPEARAAAVRDRAVRRACAPRMALCRPLYGAGDECRGRADWTAYRLLMTCLGPRFALWFTSFFHRAKDSPPPDPHRKETL